MLKYGLPFVDACILYCKSMFRHTLADYIDAYTAYDDHTIGTEAGDLITSMDSQGIQWLIGENEYKQGFLGGLIGGLSFILSQKHQHLQIVYHRDTENVDKMLATANSSILRGCSDYGVDLEALFKQREALHIRDCVREDVIISLITKVNSIPFNTRSDKKNSNNSKYNFELRNSQRPDKITSGLLNLHQSSVNAMIGAFNNKGVSIKTMDVHHLLRTAKMMIEPDYTTTHWMPRLAGDSPTMIIPSSEAKGISSFFWPLIKNQVILNDGFIPNQKTLQIAGRRFATVYMDIPPQHPQSFNKLLQNINYQYNRLPFRASFMIGSGTQAWYPVKKIAAALLAIGNQNNKKIVKAYKQLEESLANGEQSVVLKAAFTTWSNDQQPQELERRIQALVAALQGWGNCDVLVERGDPVAGFMSTLPALSIDNIGTPSIADVNTAFLLTPLARQRSPWEQGTVLFKTPDGIIWPYMPASPNQEVCIDLFMGIQRSGKSIMANTINVAYALKPGGEGLPYVSIIDVEKSSEGVIQIIQEGLPSDKKDYALHRSLTLTERDGINPFDTPLGCLKPWPYQIDFLINLLTMLATPSERASPYENMSGLCAFAIEESYQYFSPTVNPKYYDRLRDGEIDKALSNYGFNITENTSWWDVVDVLFTHNEESLAIRAQRFAVPLLEDVIQVVTKSHSINQLFNSNEREVMIHREPIVATFTRMLAIAIKQFPNLRVPTQLELGRARIVSFDLFSVSQGTGMELVRRRAVMYMLSRHVLVSRFFVNEDQLQEVPKQYYSYHKIRIREMMDCVKRVFYDEFHYVGSDPMMLKEVERDASICGKHNVHMGLSSQLIDHFSDELINKSTNIFILNVGEQHNVVIKRFELSEAQGFALKRSVNGPSRHGCPFLFIYKMRERRLVQFLLLKSPPEEIWALSTTPHDKVLRRILSERVGVHRAREILAKRFPSGSALQDIEVRINKQDILNDERVESLIQSIAEEILHES